MTHKPGNRELDGSEKAPVSGTGTYEYDGHAVDEFMWKGDTKATPVQRVGLFIFALMFLVPLAGFVAFMIVNHDWFSILIALIPATLCGIFGFRSLLNAFRHQKHHRLDR